MRCPQQKQLREQEVSLEPMDDMEKFEQELRQALSRRPAPPGLKQRVMEARRRERTVQIHSRTVLWQRLAASLVLAAALGGGFAWRNYEDRRKGEAAREQVLTALRITNHALNNVRTQLAAHDAKAGE
jgi:hypothetical protein